MEFEAQRKKNKEFLDTIDIKSLVEENLAKRGGRIFLSEIMQQLSYKYENDNLPYELEDDLFACYDEFDFYRYLGERYPDFVCKEIYVVTRI